METLPDFGGSSINQIRLSKRSNKTSTPSQGLTFVKQHRHRRVQSFEAKIKDLKSLKVEKLRAKGMLKILLKFRFLHEENLYQKIHFAAYKISKSQSTIFANCGMEFCMKIIYL